MQTAFLKVVQLSSGAHPGSARSVLKRGGQCGMKEGLVGAGRLVGSTCLKGRFPAVEPGMHLHRKAQGDKAITRRQNSGFHLPEAVQPGTRKLADFRKSTAPTA